MNAEKILSKPSDVHEEWKSDASTVGGHFFRAGGAEKLKLFRIVSLIPLPKKSFVARLDVQNVFFRRLRRVFL